MASKSCIKSYKNIATNLQHFLLKTLSFLYCSELLPLKNLGPSMAGLILASLFPALLCGSVPGPMPQCLPLY